MCLIDAQKAMDAIHPKRKAFLYPESIRNAFQTRDWKAIEPCKPADTTTTKSATTTTTYRNDKNIEKNNEYNSDNRVEELLSLLITVPFIDFLHF